MIRGSQATAVARLDQFGRLSRVEPSKELKRSIRPVFSTSKIRLGKRSLVIACHFQDRAGIRNQFLVGSSRQQQFHADDSQTVVHNLELPRTVRPGIGKMVNKSVSAMDFDLNGPEFCIGAAKPPQQLARIPLKLGHLAKNVLPAFVPQYRSPKYQPQKHFINKRFQGRTRTPRTRKMDMRPSPELAMAVSTVVALHPVCQRLASKSLPIETNLSRKNGVRMRRARKPNPAFAAQLHAKSRLILQIPADPVAVHFQAPAAFILADAILAHLKNQRARAARTQTRVLDRESLDPRPRFPLARKPRRPNLNRLLSRIACTSVASRIRQQVAEPPRATAICQAEPQEPHFITPPHRQF